MPFKNRIVLITGATSGFGHATALAMAREGAKLVVSGRREDRLAELKKEILSLRGEAEAIHAGSPRSQKPARDDESLVHTLALDVRDREAVFEAFASLPPGFTNIDILVNNAGLALGLAMAPEAELSDWEQMIDTNIKGVTYCTRALLPGMVARDRGHILNIGSVAGSYPYPGGNVYGATKAFLAQFSLNLRAELLGRNIRVTNIEPGLAETEFSLVRFHGDAEKADAVYEGVQALSAEDIAETIVWCASRPAHVNVNRLEVMPVMQAFGPFAVHRAKK